MSISLAINLDSTQPPSKDQPVSRCALLHYLDFMKLAN